MPSRGSVRTASEPVVFPLLGLSIEYFFISPSPILSLCLNAPSLFFCPSCLCLFIPLDEVYSFEKGLGEGSMGAVAAIKKKSTGQMHVLKTIQVFLFFS